MSLSAGAAVRDVTPVKPLFLAGYPHEPRTSTGIHDPLLASALYLSDGATPVVLVAVDILFVPAQTVSICRTAISNAIGVPPHNILISATHTHSGPLTNEVLAWKNDPIIPPPDRDYLEQFHQGIIEAVLAAHAAAEPARLAVTSAVAEGVGGNRLNPNGVFDPEVGLVAIQRHRDNRWLALNLIYGMHPTVLHEDSRLVSSDFPHFTRKEIAESFPDLITLYHLGPCGNLSPRHHVKGQTFSEAERLGRRLGASVVRTLISLDPAEFSDELELGATIRKVDLVANSFPTVAQAKSELRQARERHEQLKRSAAPPGEVRTAECFVFGREEALTLAEAQASGELAKWQERYRRAEIQIIRLGECFLAALPGEQFVEYGLAIKERAPRRTFIISLANGELQGYIVTPAAAAEGGYEASFALFGPESGQRMVNAALEIMEQPRP